MQVILKEAVTGLGNRGEIIKVKDGYARNFLIPNKLAILATKPELVKLEEEKRKEAEKAEVELKTYQEIASQIDGLELEIPVKISEEGKLFGAVATSQIVEQIKEQGFEIKKEQIKLEKPIKELGEYEAVIEFPHNLETKMKVLVVEETKKKDIKKQI